MATKTITEAAPVPHDAVVPDGFVLVPWSIAVPDDEEGVHAPLKYKPELVGLQYKDENTGWTDTLGVNMALAWADEEEPTLETASAVRERVLNEVAHFIWECWCGGKDIKDMPDAIRALKGKP